MRVLEDSGLSFTPLITCLEYTYRLLQFATMYDLEKTKLGCENLIGYLMYVFAYDLFSIPVIDALVDLTLPLGEKSARGFKPLGKVTRFWNSL